MKQLIFFMILSIIFCYTILSYSADRVKIAVIDTGYEESRFPSSVICDYQDFTMTGVQDTHGHGSLVAGLILKNLNPLKQCLVILKYNTGFFDSGYLAISREIEALKYAIRTKVKFINLSVNGPESNPEEKFLISLAIYQGIKVIVAAGNDGKNLDKECFSFPACYKFTKNFFVVGYHNYRSNFGSFVSMAEGNNQCFKGICMSGTSMATGNFTGGLVNE